MTTIRKIVTSKIDGNEADDTNTSEIRPFGETSFYIDNSFGNNKLTLMMFDGLRTHRKSKVLAHGILWGSSADSGDGLGYDTIKLIPDAQLKADGSDQYIVIDPTGGEPGHIHIRAGGTQDASTADLYIGGELNFVRISDTNDSVTIKTTVVGEGETNYFWSFNNAGYLTLPTGGTLGAEGMGWTGLSNGAAGTPVSVLYKTNSGNLQAGITVSGGNDIDGTGSIVIDSYNAVTTTYRNWTFSGENGSLTLPDSGAISAGGEGGLTLGGNFDVKIIADYTDNNRTWTFEGTDGSITFPDNTVQETAWAGGRVVAVPTHSYGVIGDKTGDLAFSSGYIYYCTQNYVPNSLSVTTLASSGSIVWISSADYVGDLVADFTSNSTGWTYNGITIISVAANNQFGPGYVLEGTAGFSVVNGNAYALISPITPDIWKRIAWSNDTW